MLHHSSLALLSLVLLAAVALAGCRTMTVDDHVDRRLRAQREALALAEAAAPLPIVQMAAEEARQRGEGFIFTSFRNPGPSGLYLATSRDGFHWRDVTPEPVLMPRVQGAAGIRDPNIAQGPDGVYHLVWTWGQGTPPTIGYARSTDLINWTDVRELPVVPSDWKVDYCWAPELYYDRDRQHWLIVWSSDVRGRFAETEGHGHDNHRLLAVTTPDFKELSRATVYYNPGFPCIDAAFLELGDRFILFFKDERWKQSPVGERKQIRFAHGRSPYGPWSEASDAITRIGTEGPSPIKIANHIIVYFDEYTRDDYGAVMSRDLAHWDDISPLVHFPKGQRHGSILRVPLEVVERLEARAESLGR